MDNESEKYELISSLIDNEIKSKKELDEAIDILFSDNKYINFWNSCHLLKDSLGDVDRQIEDFLNNEFSNDESKISKFNLEYLKNIFRPVAVFVVVYFLCLSIWIFYPKLHKNNYFAKNKSNNIILVESSDYTNLFHIPNQLLKSICYHIKSHNYLLNFEEYLSNVLYKFDTAVNYYEEEGLEDTNEIITNFFLSNSNNNITREF